MRNTVTRLAGRRPFARLMTICCASLALFAPVAAQQQPPSPPAAPAAPQGRTEQPQATPPMKIETEVTVTAVVAPARTDTSADVRTLPGDARVLTTLDVQNTSWRDPGEVARALPGVGFSYYGQGGIPSGPTVRGYTDRNFGQDIAGFLDGIPLNLFGFVSSHGALDLTVIVPETLERVELVRGPLESRYGDFNRGASLNFVTQRSVARPSISASAGSFGTWRVVPVFGMENVGGRGLGFYSMLQANGTDGYADNQDLRATKWFNRVHVPLGPGTLRLTALNGWGEWDAPSYLDKALVRSGVVDDKVAVNATDGGNIQHNLFYARYQAPGGGRFPFEALVYYGQRDWERWRTDSLLGPTQSQVQQLDDRHGFGYRLEQTVALLPGSRPLLAVVGTSLQRDDTDTSQANTTARLVTRQTDDVGAVITNTAVYGQVQWSATDWAKLLGGLRYSWVDYAIDDRLRAPGTFVPSYEDGVTSPKVGAVIAPARWLEFYANYATGMRSPTPRTEVRNSIGSIDRVRFAETRSYEAGVTLRPSVRADVQVNVWRALNSNEIRGIPPGGTQFESLGKSRRQGVAVDARWFFLSATRVSAGVSWVEARLLTPVNPIANRLPDIPSFVHQAGIQTPLGTPGTVAGRFGAAFDLFFYGRKSLNTTGSILGDDYARGTFRLTYDASRQWRGWLGGFFYPRSRFGEAEYLFGTRVGVRPNPRVSVEVGAAYTF